MIAVHLDPKDEARLDELAADRGETVEEIVRRFLLDRLNAAEWPEDREEDWARGSVSMAAKFLPPEDWGADAAGAKREPG